MEPLQPYFKSMKVISQTSLRRGVLNKICRQIFFLRVAQCKKTKKLLPTSYVWGQLFNVSSTKNVFWFTSSGFLKRPILLKYWLLRPFFYKEARCKSSTIKGLLYAAKEVPSKDYFTLNYCASHPQHFCAVGDVVAQRYDVLWDWFWDACHMAGVRWGSRCKGFCSKEGPHYCLEQSTRKLL